MRPTKKRTAKEYIQEDGRKPYFDWLNGLSDKRAAVKVVGAVRKMELGNFGDSKPVGESVSEYRLNYGPGYRVYYSIDGTDVIILLCGGDKSTQQSDIDKAKEFWSDFQTRKKTEKPKPQLPNRTQKRKRRS